MGVELGAFTPAPLPADVTVRPATADDLPAVLAIDGVAFEEAVEVERPWMEPLVFQPSVVVGLAERAGEPVGTGYSVFTQEEAGPCLYVAGVAVLPDARGRGVGTAVSSWLVAQGATRGARMAHLHPDTDGAARIYQRLGFVEVDGLDVYVEAASERIWR